ncbi:reverse transcriptase domain-containing protein [Sulfuricurvum sp.]|uniref:reverse transcriptase domain-containing protein n=1 Tax=Sulfuricurvum sp. TaxID=2025608 RepID=UPI003BB4D21A
MTQTSLQNAFISYFHTRYQFDDFLSIHTNEHYTEIFYSKNTFSPSKKLKDFQKFLNLFLFELLPLNQDVVFSYRKGVNAQDAISPHKNSKYVLNTDIKSFFANINTSKLKKLILDNKNNFLILPNDIEKHIDSIMNIITYNSILPVGAPTSPAISNGYLFDLDNALQRYCLQNEIIYTRYSDDFIFSSETKESLIKVLPVINDMFIHLRFETFTLNESKTRMQQRGSKIALLGLIITPQGYVTVDKNLKKEVEILLHFYLTDKEKFRDYFSKKFSSSIDKVSGLLSHINSVDSYYITKLKKRYGSFIVNSFIHRDIHNVTF